MKVRLNPLMDSLYPLLKGVSRSFYLTLRVLPGELRPQISLAYLFARASDTVADTKVVARGRRIEILKKMRGGDVEPVRELAEDQGLPAERELLERLGECAEAKASLSEEDRGLIESLLDTIIDGQIYDLERFPGEDESRIAALSDDEELDKYTYMVAGCVGEFWTRMCAAHLPQLGSWDVAARTRDGVRFGKGLQLVNVLRDMPRDLRIGRCYLPVDDPAALLDPARFDGIREEYARWLDVALEHLDAGWRYTLSVPPSLWRLRLACVWPIWLGVKTIALLRAGNPLDPDRVIMVPQAQVNWMLAKTPLICRSDGLLESSYRKLRNRAAGLSS